MESPPGTAQGMSQRLRLLDVIINPFIASQAKHLLLLSCLGGGQGTCIPPLAPRPAEESVLGLTCVAMEHGGCGFASTSGDTCTVLLVWVGNVLQDSAAIWD